MACFVSKARVILQCQYSAVQVMKWIQMRSVIVHSSHWRKKTNLIWNAKLKSAAISAPTSAYPNILMIFKSQPNSDCSRHCKQVLISGQNRLFCYRSTNQSYSTYRRGHKLLTSFSVCRKENHFTVRYQMPQNTFPDMLTAILVK